jgi:hypothetical protein
MVVDIIAKLGKSRICAVVFIGKAVLAHFSEIGQLFSSVRAVLNEKAFLSLVHADYMRIAYLQNAVAFFKPRYDDFFVGKSVFCKHSFSFSGFKAP